MSVVATRYAEALIDVATETGAVEVVGTQLTQFSQLLDANGGLLGDALRSPVFTTDERSRVLDEILPKLQLHPLVVNVLRLANDKKRFALIGDIAEAYLALADERSGRARVTVRTAEPLTPQLESEVRAALEKTTGKTVVLTTEVDPALIGGLVARVGGTVYDSSIRTRLQNIKQALLQSQTPASA